MKRCMGEEPRMQIIEPIIEFIKSFASEDSLYTVSLIQLQHIDFSKPSH